MATPIREWLQDMADIAQAQGYNADRINEVCDTYVELLAACKIAKLAVARAEGGAQ